MNKHIWLKANIKLIICAVIFVAGIAISSHYGNVKKGDIDQALLDYDKAIAINPKDSSAFDSRGNAYFAKGKYDLAILDFTKAIEINPNSALAYYNRGTAYKKKGIFDPDRVAD